MNSSVLLSPFRGHKPSDVLYPLQGILEYTCLCLTSYIQNKIRVYCIISILSLCFILELEKILVTHLLLTFLISSGSALLDLQAHTCFIRQSFKLQFPQTDFAVCMLPNPLTCFLYQGQSCTIFHTHSHLFLLIKLLY